MESIGGYRIIRRLASGDRADVLLGHAGHGPDGDPQLAAIKVFHSPVPDASVDAEISALSRLDHPHIVQLLDLATGPQNGAILILQRLEPAGLVRLLADRGVLDAGEAVTILAPLVAAVAAMHREGVTHGRLGATAILFDESGAPVLSGFGAAGSIREHGSAPLPPAALDQDPGVLADIAGLSALAVAVLARVGDGAAALRQWLVDQPPSPELLARLEGRLFAFAEPVPVRFHPEAPAGAIPNRFELGATGVPAGAEPDGLAGRRAPEWLASRLGGVLSALRAVRRRVWVVAGIGCAAMAVLSLMLQAPAGDRPVGERPEAGVTPVEALDSPALAGDDPVAAAAVLLERRARCFLERSVLCLDAVHQAESAAWQADATSIQNVQQGAELSEDSFRPGQEWALVDRMGDTALVGLQSGGLPPGNATASVLMIRTEAGWRIRGLLAGPAPLGD